MRASVHAARLAAGEAEAALRRSFDALSPPGGSPITSPGRQGASGWGAAAGGGAGGGSPGGKSRLARAAALVAETEALQQGLVPGPSGLQAAAGGGVGGGEGWRDRVGPQLDVGGWARHISGSSRYAASLGSRPATAASGGDNAGAAAAAAAAGGGGGGRVPLQALSTAELINSLADGQGAAVSLLRDVKAERAGAGAGGSTRRV